VHEAQLRLDERLGPAAVVSRFGLRWLLDTTRRCKLYDWERHQWLAFDGTPTTGRLDIARAAGSRDPDRAAMYARLAHKRALPTARARRCVRPAEF
jgi:hypothetical protein